MAIRNDFSIDFNASPRVVIIDSPSVECTMQDLLDTLRWEESLPSAMEDAPLVAASGKEPLGGGTLVGLTVSLQNTVVGFEARLGPGWVTCDLAGGNLVSFDTDGVTPIPPTYPTAYVSINKTSSASATLQEQDALNYSSYGGMVSVDITSSNSGTDYPLGNQEYPVNNISDAITIANTRGFATFGIRKTMTITSGDMSEHKFIGRSHTNVALTIEALADVQDVVIDNVELWGTLDGGTGVWTSIIKDINYFNGHIHESSLSGRMTLGGGTESLFSHCTRELATVIPILDFNNGAEKAVFDSYNGGIQFENMTNAGAIANVGLARGAVILDSATCTAGSIYCVGTGLLMDENSNLIETGTWNGVTIVNNLISNQSITDAVWSSLEGEIVKKMLYNKTTVSGDIATIYDDDGVTVWKQFNIANDGRVEV